MTQQSVAQRNAGVDAKNALLNGGTVEIRTGAEPSIGTESGTVLATFTIANPAFPAASGGSASANAISDVTASATGTAGHYIAKNSSNAIIRSGTAGTSGTDMILNTSSITSGDNVSITAWNTSEPT